jgi:alanyl-tRNA synthetase
VGRTEAPSVEIFRRQGDQLAKALGSGAGLLAARVGNKISLLAVVTPDLASSGSDLRADRIVQEVAAVAGGRGGGNPQMALAGVGDPSRLEEALAAARELLRKALKG